MCADSACGGGGGSQLCIGDPVELDDCQSVACQGTFSVLPFFFIIVFCQIKHRPSLAEPLPFREAIHLALFSARVSFSAKLTVM